MIIVYRAISKNILPPVSHDDYCALYVARVQYVIFRLNNRMCGVLVIACEDAFDFLKRRSLFCLTPSSV